MRLTMILLIITTAASAAHATGTGMPDCCAWSCWGWPYRAYSSILCDGERHRVNGTSLCFTAGKDLYPSGKLRRGFLFRNENAVSVNGRRFIIRHNVELYESGRIRFADLAKDAEYPVAGGGTIRLRDRASFYESGEIQSAGLGGSSVAVRGDAFTNPEIRNASFGDIELYESGHIRRIQAGDLPGRSVLLHINGMPWQFFPGRNFDAVFLKSGEVFSLMIPAAGEYNVAGRKVRLPEESHVSFLDFASKKVDAVMTPSRSPWLNISAPGDSISGCRDCWVRYYDYERRKAASVLFINDCDVKIGGRPVKAKAFEWIGL